MARYRRRWSQPRYEQSRSFEQPGSTVVDLGAQGLTDGDDVTPFLEQYFQSGNMLTIPSGTYRLSNPTSALSGEFSNCSIIGSDDGVVFQRDQPSSSNKYRPFIRASGDVRFENFTVRGVSLGRGVDDSDRWRFDAVDPGATIEVVNVNFPDGTEDCSDAIAFYTGSRHRGTVHYKNCYASKFGNSMWYINQGYSSGRNNPVILDNCVLIDPVNIRAGTNGSIYRDCTFVYRTGHVGWIDCSRLSRGIRWDQGGRDMLVENCHFHVSSESQLGNGVSGMFEFENYNHGGTIRDIFIHNATDSEMFQDRGGLGGNWSFENINITGPGRTSSSNVSVSGTTAPDLRNENVVWMPESETVRPRGGSNGGGGGGGNGGGGGQEGVMFQILSNAVGADLFYEFVVDGTVDRARASDQVSSIGEENVDIRAQTDGTMLVTGKTGGQYGDAFLVTGSILSFQKTGGESGYELLLGDRVVTEDPTGPVTGGDGGGGTVEAGLGVGALVALGLGGALAYRYTRD